MEISQILELVKSKMPSKKTLMRIVMVILAIVAVLIGLSIRTAYKKQQMKPLLLAEKLYDKDPEVRQAAATEIGALGPKGTAHIPDLIIAAQDPHWLVRFRAVEALGNVGSTDPDGVGALATALRDQNFDVRQAAVDALANIGSGSRQGVIALTASYPDDDKIFRTHLLTAGERLFEQVAYYRVNQHDEAVSKEKLELEKARKAALPEDTTQSLYVKRLHAQATATAVAVQNAKDTAIALKAKKKSGDAKPKPTPVKAKSKKELEKEKAAAQAKKDEETAQAMLDASKAARDADIRAETDALIVMYLNALEDVFVPNRLKAVGMLGRLGHLPELVSPQEQRSKIVPALIKTMRTDQEFNVKLEVAHALRRIGDEEGLKAIERDLPPVKPKGKKSKT